MKKLIVVIITLIPLFAMPANRISIAEAVNNKSISCNIKNLLNIPDSLQAKSGIKMLLNLQNNSNNDLEIILESGRRFMSGDSSHQNLIITQERLITLKAGEKREYPVISYCTNADKDSPANNPYKLGSLAKGILLKVANFLGKKKVISKAAQSAIWVVTDKHSIQTINGNSKYETRMVRNYLYDITGQPRPPRNTDPLCYPEVFLNGEIGWNMSEPGKINIYVLDKNGKQIGSLVKERNYQAGNQIYSFHYLDDYLVPGEPYNVKVITNDKVIKEIKVMGQENQVKSSLL